MRGGNRGNEVHSGYCKAQRALNIASISLIGWEQGMDKERFLETALEIVVCRGCATVIMVTKGFPSIPHCADPRSDLSLQTGFLASRFEYLEAISLLFHLYFIQKNHEPKILILLVIFFLFLDF